MLITGAGINGVTGRLARDYFAPTYNVLAPGSDELDLTDGDLVSAYFGAHKIDYVLHCATFRKKTARQSNFVNDDFESNVRMFFNLAAHASGFKKMVYFGSGAEFGKDRDICMASENIFGACIPKDKYGFGKYLMNLHSAHVDNIVNLRLFGTINPYERPAKNVVSNLVVKVLKGMPMTLNRNCRFSFVFMQDVLPLVEYVLKNDLPYNDFNLAMPKPYTLLEVADIVTQRVGTGGVPVFKYAGMGKEYTASSARSIEFLHANYTDLQIAVDTVIDFYKDKIDNISVEGIDERWGA